MCTSRPSALAVATLALLVVARPSAGGGFAGELPPIYGPAITEALASSVGRYLPVPAASAGFRYRFDPTTNVFERDIPLLGQLYVERAETVGAGHWQLDVGWQRIDFDSYEGRDLDEVRFGRVRVPPQPVPIAQLRARGTRVDLDVDQAFLGATWGATERFELNVTLPLLYSRFSENAGGVFILGSTLPYLRPQGLHDSAFGPGDLLVRGKWRFASGAWGRLAGGLGLQFPTGSNDDFQGTGEFELSPLLFASTPRARVAGIEIEGHINLGFRIASTDVEQSEGRWGAGLDVSPHPRIAVGVAVLGRHAFSGPSVGTGCEERSLDPSNPRSCLAAVLRGDAPATSSGIATGRPDFYDFSAGLRVRIWRDRLIAFGNVLVPLNDDGFRASVIPLLGLEATF